MKRKKIFKFLSSALIAGTVLNISPVRTYADWKYENNSWKYEEDNKNVSGWKYVDYKWYYFNQEGVMQSDWIKDNNMWYYLEKSGEMKSGWIEYNQDWYYLNSTGDMKSGWLNYKNDWYYLEPSGKMKSGWLKDGESWYYFNTNGVMQTRWLNDKNDWYYLNDNGVMQTGVISVADKVYYLNVNGAMQIGKFIIKENEYEFNNYGEAVGDKPHVEKDKIFEPCENNETAADKDISESSEIVEESSNSSNHSSSKKKKWNLVWEDDFSGDELDLDNWNYETHEPGWVNSELQEYTDSKENIFVKDGKLVLKAIETDKDGEKYYTSGKVTTQNKQTFKYGKFEIKAKTPKGQGLWPALWMMPNDESLYGQWPKCGEIDIMEVLGHEPEKTYGTIHYGNPHNEQQGYYVLDKGTFADDYHVYGLEWEPGEMRFYIDGKLFHKVNDWFTKVEGGDETAYPAPFDQPFYLQCNLAVGGSWPGNPDETTDFDNAEFMVDYIKVYQLDKYNENVKKPEAEDVILRDPDENGNYIINGDFSEDKDWTLLKAMNGAGTAEIKNNKIIIKTENSGTVDYSLQLVQPGIPLKKGGIYKISFDAKASNDRSMIVDISGPDRSWIRYFNDTKVNLTNDLQTYSYEFTMEGENDANGRIEFNLGNQGSTEDIEISNVRIIKTGEIEETEDDSKKIMPDGNYVNNGTFDVGEDRMKYWEIESKSKSVQISATNIENSRELKVNVKKQPSELSDVIVKQTNLALEENKEYTLSFDAYAEEDKTIGAQINDECFEAELTKEKKNFKFEFKTGDTLNNADLEFLLGTLGVTYIDNVRIEESSLIRNGSFNSGFTGWTVFADGGLSAKPSYGVDGLIEDNAAQITIEDTGDADWKIQLKQGNVKLEEGKRYKLSLDVKSTIAREIMFAIQRDGSKDDNWDPYSGSQVVNVDENYKTYEVEFNMEKVTDKNAIFTISMGAVNNKQVTDKHMISIDNVTLEEIE